MATDKMRQMTYNQIYDYATERLQEALYDIQDETARHFDIYGTMLAIELDYGTLNSIVDEITESIMYALENE